jgi:hypothetical protein
MTTGARNDRSSLEFVHRWKHLEKNRFIHILLFLLSADET